MRSRYELEMEEHDKHITWMAKNGGFVKDLTVRDHIAIEAMKALLGPFLMKGLDEVDPEGWMEGVSMDAYSMADAMLRERDAE
jgi:hypothetical protein